MSTISQPASFSQAMPSCQSFSISAGMLSTRYSFGIPIFRPFTDLPTNWVKSGTGMSRLVESLGSWPDIEVSSRAASSTVLAMGPAWSSELAKATTPQREQRP